jgi:hypothetical protein
VRLIVLLSKRSDVLEGNLETRRRGVQRRVPKADERTVGDPFVADVPDAIVRRARTESSSKSPLPDVTGAGRASDR